MITKSIGKNTLGGGNKMNVNMRTYNRSTHNLSHVWRNTQSVGTLVPFLVEPALPGDTHEIKLNANVMTHPTVGPLFGSFKLQLDVFSCPIRLYQAKLHNNALGIGLDMSKVFLPYAGQVQPNKEFKSSSLLSYLGVRGNKNSENIMMVPYLAYWDIYKNYFCNKQEKNAAYIGGNNMPSGIIYNNNTESFSYKWEGYTTYTEPFQIHGNNNTNIKIQNVGSRYQETMEIGLSSSQNSRITWTKMGVHFSLDDSNNVWNLNDDSMDGYYVRGLRLSTDTPIIGIRQFPLENLDKMREEILKGNLDIASIGYINDIYPYKTVLPTSDNYNDGEAVNSINTSQYQLALKTYQSDIFNNWIQTEWIDGDNGINAITAIDTTKGEFTLDTLNMAKKVYDMLNRIALSGGTYQDWIETVYTNNYIERSETPIYEGGMSQEIVFQEVISQSATEEEPLGSLAGRGILSEGSRKGGIIKIKTSEPSFIIGIVSITPRIDYSQGNAYWNNWRTMNDLHKPALDGIGFQDLLENKMAWWGTGAVGKQPAWLDYMTAVNRVYGNFAAGYSESFMILDRNYTPDETGDHIKDLTTYIDPSKWNGIFADQSIDAMNFWVQIGIGMQARRVMSAKMIPNL